MNKQVSTLLGIIPVIESIADTLTNAMNSVNDSIKRASALENAKFLKELAALGIDEEMAERAKKTKELLEEIKSWKD